MKGFALVLIAMLLVGCASTTKQHQASNILSISQQSWQQLQGALRDASGELYRAVLHEGEARLQHSGQTEALKDPETKDQQALLVDILTHTRNQVLLSDKEFDNLNNVVIGINQQPQLSYAAALAAYLTQPDFACQQPLYSVYFDRKYALSRRHEQCRAEVPFSVLTQYEGTQVVWLEPKRVKSIHLLFASKSGSAASRFGHVALRLVVCPKGKTTDAECDANLTEHLVLGFRAHIDELSINVFKALSGEYKAYLFANPFMDVYEEYAIGEFRDVYSLPLRLDDAQRQLMVRELADIHWRYTGDYSFFTRNCATLLQNALRATWSEFASSEKFASDYLRPDSFFDALKSSPLASGERLNSLDVAEREGYYFSNTGEFYDRALNEVRSAMKNPIFIDLESYLNIHPVKRRQDRVVDASFSLKLVADQHLREAQIMLEEYAVLRSERLLRIEGAKYFEQQDILSKSDSIRSQLDAEHAKVFDDCLISPIKGRAYPILRLQGIPNKSDLPGVSGQAIRCRSAQSKKILSEAIAAINDEKSEQWQIFNGISQYYYESIANLNLLKQM